MVPKQRTRRPGHVLRICVPLAARTVPIRVRAPAKQVRGPAKRYDDATTAADLDQRRFPAVRLYQRAISWTFRPAGRMGTTGAKRRRAAHLVIDETLSFRAYRIRTAVLA